MIPINDFSYLCSTTEYTMKGVIQEIPKVSDIQVYHIQHRLIEAAESQVQRIVLKLPTWCKM